jgi:ribosomal subunit interface protein
LDIVVKSRHCEVTDRFRGHVEEKLARLEKHDHRVIRVEVEVDQERNPRLQEQAVRVQLTAFSKGPVIRSEAAAEDKMGALDLALDRMAGQMRRAADRRRVHRGRRTPVSVGQALAAVPFDLDGAGTGDAGENGAAGADGAIAMTGDGPLVVRRKSHAAKPMSLDQALYAMELVGHDFYLFVDKESGQPSVVYRRHGYDYGVISLDVS